MLRVAMVVLFAASLWAQSFDASLGGSQLYQSSGLQTNYQWGKLSGWVGTGYANGVEFGGLLSAQVTQQDRIDAGDQRLSGFLDVDAYDTHSFPVRGLGFVKSDLQHTSTLQVFSGLLSEETYAPYLHSFSTGRFSNTLMSAVLYQRKWGSFRFHSLNLVGGDISSIQSLGWTPSSKWRFAGAAGMGSGAPYAAGAGEYSDGRWHVRSSYTVADHSFHRQEGLVNTEPIGFNLRADFKPAEAVKLGFAHENSLTYMLNYPTALGHFNSVFATASLKGFQLNANASTSLVSTSPGRTTTEIFSASRRVLPRWRSFGSFVHLDGSTTRQNYLVATNEFRINSHLALRQNYIRMNGQNSNSVGASWTSNPISFSVEQQLYVSPIAAAFGGKTVFQAWTFNLRLRTFKGTTANLDNSIAPDGRSKWGAYLSGLRYSAIAPVAEAPDFSAYVVRGVVVDEAGQGVWGIAVQIGEIIVVSGSEGEFFTHVKGAKQLPVTLVKDASLQPRPWSVQSAPGFVKGVAEKDTSSEPLRIVLATNNTSIRPK